MNDKPGWQTTEFWLTLAVTVLTWIQTQDILKDGSVGEKLVAAALTVLAALGYTVGRSAVKAFGKRPSSATYR